MPRNPKSHRNPPAEHRFKPGQSGNPKGRPPGSRNKVTRGAFARIVVDEAERTGSGGVSAYREVVRALFAEAATGRPVAAKLILQLAADAEATVAELDAADEARAAEAAAAEEQRAAKEAAADQTRAEAAEDEALATKLAANEPELYKHARRLMAPTGPFMQPSKFRRFSDAVAHAKVQIALGLKPHEDVDPYVAAATLAKMAADEAEETEAEEEPAEADDA